MEKTEKIISWKDLERENKVAIIVGILMFGIIEFGIYKEAKKAAQIQQNAVKTEMIRQR